MKLDFIQFVLSVAPMSFKWWSSENKVESLNWLLVFASNQADVTNGVNEDCVIHLQGFGVFH